jgi:hypothetical protein
MNGEITFPASSRSKNSCGDDIFVLPPRSSISDLRSYVFFIWGDIFLALLTKKKYEEAIGIYRDIRTQLKQDSLGGHFPIEKSLKMAAVTWIRDFWMLAYRGHQVERILQQRLPQRLPFDICRYQRRSTQQNRLQKVLSDLS